MTTASPARMYPTLSAAVFPQQTLVRHAALVIASALFIAVCAQVSIRLAVSPVPITMQPFAVLLVGGLLGMRLGMASAALYVALGVFGLPVYAGQVAKEGFAHAGSISFGWSILMGGSGGYLMAYPFVTALVGYLAERGWDRAPVRLAAAMLAGNVLIYVFGLPWLYMWAETNPALSGVTDMDVATTLKWGLLPFIPGDLAKSVLAAGLVPSGWQLFRVFKVRNAETRKSAPASMRLAPLGIAAGLAMAAAPLLPWSGGVMPVTSVSGALVLVAGLDAATCAMLRARRMIGLVMSQIWMFAAASVGGLIAFVHLVEFTAMGELALASFGLGVPVAVVSALLLLAVSASESGAE